MAPLELHTTLNGDGNAVIALSGELDLSNAALLEDEIERLAEAEDVQRAIIDLRGLAFLDSSGLRVVAMADRRLGDAGRRLVLVRGRETVQRVFAITKLDERLDFVDSLDALDANPRDR